MDSRAPFPPVAPASPLGALPDDALVALASDGSEAAFETLDRRHRPAVYRHCVGILRNAHDADEAAQRTMIRAYRALAAGRGPASVAPWFLAIARNESYDLLRARRGTETLTVEIEAGGASPVEHLERREQVEALRDDLAALPDTQRRALLLRGVGDLSHAEIARLMGGTPTEMRTLVHEARVSLAEFEAGRALPCADVRDRIATGDGRALRARRVRAHIRACEPCAVAAAAVGAPGRRRPAGRLAALLPLPLFGAIRAALFGGAPAGVAGSAGPVGAVGVSAAVVASLVIGLGGGGGTGGGAIDGSAPPPDAVAPALAAQQAAPSSGAASGTTAGRSGAPVTATPRAATPGAGAGTPAGAAPAAAPSGEGPQTQAATGGGGSGSAGSPPSTGPVATPSVTVAAVGTPAVTVPSVTVPSVRVPSVVVPAVATPPLPIVGGITTPEIATPPIATPPIATPSVTVPGVGLLPQVRLPGAPPAP